MQDSFKVGDRVVSPQLNTISRNGTTNRVEPKAMLVLTCLAARPGEVVAKDELIETVWAETHVTDDVLTGCISALRKAFEDNPKSPAFIQTIPKSGYRLIAPVGPMNGKSARPQASSLNLWWPLGLALVVVLGLAAWWLRPAKAAIDSIAVLPFTNSGIDSNSEILADGISESIIDSVSRLPNLRVMAWTTVSRYRNRMNDPLAVGRELGVKAIVTGQVIRSGDQLQLRTELVDLSTGSRLWGEEYTRELNQVIPLQDEIARRVSENLRIKLNGAKEKALAHGRAVDPEAYTLYLKGRYFWNKRNEDSLHKAIGYFQQAIDHDPTYAAAYAGLADSYNLLDDWGSTPPAESFPRARAAAQKALELDDSLAEAHTSLAFVKANYDWDLPGAEREFQRAIELNPSYATAHQWYALYLAPQKRFAEAEREIKTAQELDPLSLIINLGVGEVLEWQKNYDAALNQYKKTLELDPNFLGTHGHLATIYEEKGMLREAVDELKKIEIIKGSPEEASALERLFREHGFPAIRRHNFEQDMKLRAAGKYVKATEIAEYYAGLGEHAHATEWLDKAYDERCSSLAFLPIDPVFESLHGDPEFQTLLKKIGYK